MSACHRSAVRLFHSFGSSAAKHVSIVAVGSSDNTRPWCGRTQLTTTVMSQQYVSFWFVLVITWCKTQEADYRLGMMVLLVNFLNFLVPVSQSCLWLTVTAATWKSWHFITAGSIVSHQMISKRCIVIAFSNLEQPVNRGPISFRECLRCCHLQPVSSIVKAQQAAIQFCDRTRVHNVIHGLLLSAITEWRWGKTPFMPLYFCR